MGFKEINEKINMDDGVLGLSTKWGKIDVSSLTKTDPFIHGTETKVQISTLETDPSGRPLNSPGAKADAGKLRPWLVLGQFSHALEEVVKVGSAGAIKYTDNGWLDVPKGKDRYMDAYARHMLEIGKGNQIDNGPNGIGTLHLANSIWNLLAVLELQLRDK